MLGNLVCHCLLNPPRLRVYARQRENYKVFPQRPLWIWSTIGRRVQCPYQKEKRKEKGMGMMGCLDMDVETNGLTRTTKLCKDMHKWVHEN